MRPERRRLGDTVPSFVGTFDAFIRKFIFIPIAGDRATVFESWQSIEIDVRLRGRRAFAGPGVPLDLFDAESARIDPSRLRHLGLKQHVEANKAAYEAAAQQRRNGLWQAMKFSSADARYLARVRLEEAEVRRAVLRAIRGRFSEIVVDEGQDCNRDDLQVLSWLRDAGIPVMVVSDPDQAIYGFRYGSPGAIRGYSEHYAATDRLELRGNFRSSQVICDLASTLRGNERADIAVGPEAQCDQPVQLLAYEGVVDGRVGVEFELLVEQAGMAAREAIILAHSRSVANRAAGRTPSASGGTSRVAAFGRALAQFWAPGANTRDRERSIKLVEGLILQYSGVRLQAETPAHAMLRAGIDQRRVRRQALSLMMNLPRTCADTADGRTAWIDELRRQLAALDLSPGHGSTVARFLRTPPQPTWSTVLSGDDVTGLPASTIHEAKGREYMAVCVVIPPDRGSDDRTSNLIASWAEGIELEAKRVVYVGVTRAIKLLGLALPREHAAACERILGAAGVRYETSEIGGS